MSFLDDAFARVIGAEFTLKEFKFLFFTKHMDIHHAYWCEPAFNIMLFYPHSV